MIHTTKVIKMVPVEVEQAVSLKINTVGKTLSVKSNYSTDSKYSLEYAKKAYQEVGKDDGVLYLSISTIDDAIGIPLPVEKAEELADGIIAMCHYIKSEDYQ